MKCEDGYITVKADINVENHAKQIIEAVGGAYLMQIMTEEEVYEAAANRMALTLFSRPVTNTYGRYRTKT